MFFDWFGALTSLLSTYYYIRLDSKAWIISLIAICVNGWLYWQKGIYADMMLESFYFLSTCYGWFCWRRKKVTSRHIISSLSVKQWLYLFIGFFAIYQLIIYLLTTFTHSTIAKLDALTTSLSLIAQWLMCHKVLATWILWFIADAWYAILYYQKSLPFHSILMLLYTGLAVAGYLTWLRKTKSTKSFGTSFIAA